MIDETFRERFIFPYKEQIGFSTVDFGKRAITYFGYAPKQLQIDNSAEFTNFSRTKRVHIFDKFCLENGIEHKLIRPRTPCHNGKVERSHHSDQEALQKILCKSKSSQTIGGLQSKRDLGFPLNSHAPVSRDGMRTEGVNTVSVCGKNIKRGNFGSFSTYLFRYYPIRVRSFRSRAFSSSSASNTVCSAPLNIFLMLFIMSVVPVKCWMLTNSLSSSFDVFSIKKHFLSDFP